MGQVLKDRNNPIVDENTKELPDGSSSSTTRCRKRDPEEAVHCF
ncbi:hypothetical protein D1AOALGA4SA_10089 [Olavius algarvensis Delta 1 endosymbiont]|nr:hypothetical protein D1AOALGA4SA_10089 [Olavius algarvensis Delta 1 endosymbiont]